MGSNKRLLQVFISHQSNNPGPGIFEVSTTPEKEISCNCPGFAAKSSCKHVALVESRIELGDGKYPFNFSDKVTKNEIITAMQSEELFREFVIKHGKVEIY
jgi:hypothetical protein